jgi:glycosyltransferase involved in cell wall biosynthesis
MVLPQADRQQGDGDVPSFCIALPVFNEENGIDSCVENIARYLATLSVRTAIIAVDDGSTDNTWNHLERLRERIPMLILVRHEHNAGYGGAQRTLARVAYENGFDYALVMDADGTQEPQFIANFLPLMRAGIDFIKGTRYDLGGTVDGVPWQRYLISFIGNKIARTVTRLPLTDFSNGFRAIRTDAWRKLATTERGFLVLIEEVRLAQRVGLSFGEVPYTLTVRSDAGSVSKFSYRWEVYWNFLRHVLSR